MDGSWTEIAVLLRNFLGFIWDPSDVFTVHICSARAQMQSFKTSWIVHDDFENLFYLNYSMTTKKYNKNSSVI